MSKREMRKAIRRMVGMWPFRIRIKRTDEAVRIMIYKHWQHPENEGFIMDCFSGFGQPELDELKSSIKDFRYFER